jgi:hypothetical protein
MNEIAESAAAGALRFQLGISAEAVDFGDWRNTNHPSGYTATDSTPTFDGNNHYQQPNAPAFWQAPPVNRTMPTSTQPFDSQLVRQSIGRFSATASTATTTATSATAIDSSNVVESIESSGLYVDWNNEFQTLLEIKPTNEPQRLDKFDKLRYRQTCSLSLAVMVAESSVPW